MEQTVELTQKQAAVCDLTEAAVTVIAGLSIKKGLKFLISAGVDKICDGMAMDEKTYNSIKHVINISTTLVSGKISADYGSYVGDIVRGGFNGYNTGCQMAKGQNLSGSESEVLAGGSEEEC